MSIYYNGDLSFFTLADQEVGELVQKELAELDGKIILGFWTTDNPDEPFNLVTRQWNGKARIRKALFHDGTYIDMAFSPASVTGSIEVRAEIYKQFIAINSLSTAKLTQLKALAAANAETS